MGVVSRLHLFRAERGWTQGELAQRVGVSRQTINSIETGRFEPSLGLGLRLAALFEVPVETLFSLGE
jgi:putative transcriptional regulator